MPSNNELQMINYLIHYMGVQSATQEKKRYRCTLLIHYSYWASSHWAFPLTSEALNTESIKRPQSDLALPPVVLIWTPLKLLWIPYELSWVQLLQEKECAEYLDPSQWCIYLKVWSQYFWAWTLRLSVNISLVFFFILNTLLNRCAVATAFIPNSFRNRFG